MGPPRLQTSAFFILAVALVYFLAGRFGLYLSPVHQSVAGVWPPSGIALALCLLVGNRVWPGIFLGALAIDLATSHAIGPSLLISAANTFECLLGAWFIRRFAGGLEAFDTAPAIVVFTESVVAAALLGATLGVVALMAGNLVPGSRVYEVWLTWWLGDATGALIITPFIILWWRDPFEGWSWPRVIEAAILLAIIVVTGYWMFDGAAGARRYPLTFLPFPPLLWIALRFGPRETMAAVLIFAVFAIGGTMRGIGPFAWSSPIESLGLLQSFLGVSTLASLALAAEAKRRRSIEREVVRFNAELTERVEARTNELRRLHSRLAEAQHVARVGSWEWNIGDDVVWWSEELYRIYDLEVGSPVTYATFLERVHPDDRARVEATVTRAVETREPFAFEHRILLHDGTVRILSAHGRVTIDESGQSSRMMGIGLDITDRKRAEEERIQLLREQEARREAEESNRSKDQFLANLSHELRTPLNAVLGWAELLRSPRTDAELRVRAIDAITRNVWIQAQLVSDILDVARIRSGTLRLQPRPVVLLDVINAALEIVGPMMVSKNIKVRVSVPDGLDEVIGDSQRLQQVFWNILSNAAKFTPPNGHVGVTASKSDFGIDITVEDDGPGIDPAFLPHVFEQFSQADGSVTRQHSGLGLGLAITHQLVRLHNGEIAAANRPEGGATFTIRLPVGPAPAEALGLTTFAPGTNVKG